MKRIKLAISHSRVFSKHARQKEKRIVFMIILRRTSNFSASILPFSLKRRCFWNFSSRTDFLVHGLRKGTALWVCHVECKWLWNNRHLTRQTNNFAMALCFFVRLNHSITARQEWVRSRSKRVQVKRAQDNATMGQQLRGMSRNRFESPMLVFEWRNRNGHFKLVLMHF